MRSWLQAHHLAWLTPARMRIVTITLMVAAFAVSSIGLSSSTHAGRDAAQSPHAGQAAR